MARSSCAGATGRAGSQLLEEALRRGHHVTAIARNTAKIGERAGVDPALLFETLSKGSGDCEDYAIAKYFTLVAGGVPAASLPDSIMKPTALVVPLRRLRPDWLGT
mgnify:CR=1 FL=1